MYVIKKGDEHYVRVLGDGKNYVNAVSIEGTTALTVYMPDGSLLTNADITVNGVAYMTDAAGKVYLTGEYGKPVVFDIVYSENYKGSIKTTYGTDVSAQLIRLYLLTVIATGFTYSSYFTVTTTIDGVETVGSLSQYVEAGTEVTITNVGDSAGNSDGYNYYGSYIVDNETSTGSTSYSFAMNEDHTITFTNGSRSWQSVGT